MTFNNSTDMIYFSQQIAQMKQIYEHYQFPYHPERSERISREDFATNSARFLTSFEMTLITKLKN